MPDLISLILKVGGIQALIFACILFFRKNQHILATLLLTLGISCVLYTFEKIEILVEFPHLIRLSWGMPLLFGPLIFFQLKKWSQNQLNWQSFDLWHLSPYIINLIVLCPFFFKNGEKKIQALDYFTSIISAGIDHYRIYFFILQFATALSGLFYSERCLQLVNDHVKKLKNEYTETEKVKLTWARLLSYSLSVLSAVLLIAVMINFYSVYPVYDYQIFYFFGLFLLIYLMTFQTLNQATLPGSQDSKTVIKINKNQLKVGRKTLEPSTEARLLLDYLQKEKPFLEGTLTATQLADHLGISRHQLSEVLNQNLGKSFYSLINEYRLEEFKKKLSDPAFSHLTLFSLALESGFNSKTAFNAYFKKQMGMTPLKYKKMLEKSASGPNQTNTSPQ